MRSKTSFFNGQLYRTALKRFWPLWGAYALVLFTIVPLPFMNMHGEGGAAYINRVSNQVLTLAWNTGCVISFIMAAAVAMCVFGYLYSQRHTGMMASLPVKREAMYISSFLAGLTAMLAVDIVIFLITLAAEAGSGCVDISALWQWLAIMAMMNLSFYGFAAFCAMLTGNLAVLPLVYALLEFTAFGVETFTRRLLEVFVFGMSGDGGALTFLSPIISLMGTQPGVLTSDDGVSLTYIAANQWIMLGAYCAAGIVFAVLGLALYKHRRMENATDVVAIPVLRPVFKYCMAVGCSLVLGVLLFYVAFNGARSSGAALYIFLFMLCGAFIGYFGADMLIKKTFRVFSGNWKGFIIVCCAAGALVLCCKLDLFGYERRVPDAANVASVSVNVSGEMAKLTEPDNIASAIALHKSIVSHEDLHTAYGVSSTNMRLVYVLKDGSVFTRSYTVRSDASQGADANSDILKLQALINTHEAIMSRKATTVPVTASNISSCHISYYDEAAESYVSVTIPYSDAVKLYQNCIVPDIDSGALGRVWLITEGTDYDRTVYALQIDINLYDNSVVRTHGSGYDGKYYDSFYTTLTTDAVNTLAWIKANTNIQPVLQSELPADTQKYAAAGSAVMNAVPIETAAADAPAASPAAVPSASPAAG